MIMKKQTGFTLPELMITLVVAGILLAVGMPAMSEFIKNGRITSVTNELVSALMVARSEAIRQSATSCVCPTTTANDAVPVCVASDSWESGWIAFVDYNGNCVIDGVAPTKDVLLKAWDGTDYVGSVTVRNNNALINSVDSVRFNGRGETEAGGLSQTGVFSICDDRPLTAGSTTNVAAAVNISAAGSARSTRLTSQITYTAP